MKYSVRLFVVGCLLLVGSLAWKPGQAAEKEAAKENKAVFNAEAVEARLLDSIKFIADDEREGRGLGTKGLDQAADYLVGQFKEIGLKTDLVEGGAFQKFKQPISSELGPKEQNYLTLVGPADKTGQNEIKIKLKLDEDFRPLALGGGGNVDFPIVFAGYGITGKAEKYDDFAGQDVKGKAVILLRHEPQQDDPKSVFDGTKDSAHAALVKKVSNAYEHGAAMVLFCTDEHELSKKLAAHQKQWQAAVDEVARLNTEYKKLEKPTPAQSEAHRKKVGDLSEKIVELNGKYAELADPLLTFHGGGGGGEGRNFPVVHCRRAPLDEMLRIALKTNLAALEKQIDDGPKPRSHELPEWRIQGEIAVVRKEVEIKNVLAVLEGEGPLADETLVIGAHYDHVGRGGPGSGSLAPGLNEIHNGADDNGSGTVALVEVARVLAAREKKLPRRIVFIAFTAEEEGLIGSARYVKDPVFPLDKTVAMLNMDMVGRLKDEKLIVYGTGTAAEFDGLTDRYGEKFGFQIKKDPAGFGPSDHASFYGKKIPVLHFFTGTHADYHRPTDDVEKLNIGGMRRVAEMVAEMAVEIAETEQRPTYKEVKGTANPRGDGGNRPWLGTIPDYGPSENGLPITGVTKDSPAEKAGMKGDDVIVHLGESRIGNIEDLAAALGKYKPGDKIVVVVRRDGKEVSLDVTLAERPQ